ncbi:hypothetical protein AX15_001604 [Amanita polypyramis BW_CC]|nr:hypothetical protein AX15_001604 [Amanita polypyramis BW_CC]
MLKSILSQDNSQYNQAPKGKEQNPSGLGRAIINRKIKDARKAQESGLFTTDIDTSTRLQSVTQERDLDEFLNTAQLAGVEFTAERRNVKIIQQSTNSLQNPYLLNEREEKATIQKHEENKNRLRVPRRPPWTKSTTSAALDRQEKAAFLDWRRGLAQLQEQDKFLLTPFERNLEVWRQLWRVLERSHLVVQIVDARNPLHFRCEDLESYVHDLEGNEGEAGTGKGSRRNLLLINKADLLTVEQRCQWADYFERQGIDYAFYSAASVVALQQAREESSALLATQRGSNSDASHLPTEGNVSSSKNSSSDSDNRGQASESGTESEDTYIPFKEATESRDPRAKILSVVELEDLFLQKAPDLSVFIQPSGERPTKLVVGLVGYPNVGKSSTINSLLGEKKVSVSSTPGKTKHFQTIHLSESIILCDCPGLVFPQFATTKADLVCDGVLPIDQLREYTGPTSLVSKRIPKEVLEATYGLSIKVKSIEEGGNDQVTAENLLKAYASTYSVLVMLINYKTWLSVARGFMRSSQGNPDEARAARYILKDYVNGKLLFCHSPPGIPPAAFNEATHGRSLARAIGKKRAPTTRVTKNSDTFVPPTPSPLNPLASNTRTKAIDEEFFSKNSISHLPHILGSVGHGKDFTRPRALLHQNMVADDGSLIDPQQAQSMAFLSQAVLGKKHHKKTKRVKQRSGRGYDED